MHRDHDIFVRAINDRRKVVLNYLNDKHRLNCNRLCVPVYYSPTPTEEGDFDCYYLWDLKDDIGKRFLGLPPSQIMSMELRANSS
ncbi:unnamed protein product, partial [marine sediment metagenome]